MNEFLFYKIFDAGSTLIEAILMLFLMTVLTDKDIRSFKSIKFIIWHVIITVALTYTISNLVLKVILLSVGMGLGWSIIKKMDLLKSLIVTLLTLGWIATIQGTVNYSMTFLRENPSFDMGGFYIGSWQYTAASQAVCVCLTFLFCRIFWNRTFRWVRRDFIIISIIGYMELVMISLGLDQLNRNGVSARNELLISLCLFWVTFFLIIHFQQTSDLRIKEEKENQRLKKLEMEMSYYHDRAEEEQKIRKLYHDMKNLIIAVKLKGAETSLLDSVEQELKEYSRYCETGNVLLNVILKEKLKLAEEKSIDIQVDADFSSGSFMQDRDMVVIFGNALDNAIEACEKVPAQERYITVKAGKIRNMLSVIIENSMPEEQNHDLHTTKQDAFLHGFGIRNMKEAAAGYDGECTAEMQGGRFTLKILIPVP